jgi:hypothetical protein
MEDGSYTSLNDVMGCYSAVICMGKFNLKKPDGPSCVTSAQFVPNASFHHDPGPLLLDKMRRSLQKVHPTNFTLLIGIMTWSSISLQPS